MSRLVFEWDEDISFILACLAHAGIRTRAETTGCSIQAAYQQEVGP